MGASAREPLRIRVRGGGDKGDSSGQWTANGARKNNCGVTESDPVQELSSRSGQGKSDETNWPGGWGPAIAAVAWAGPERFMPG